MEESNTQPNGDTLPGIQSQTDHSQTETHETEQELPPHVQKLVEMAKLNSWILEQLSEQEKIVVGKIRHWTRVFNDVQRKLIAAKAERTELATRFGGEDALQRVTRTSEKPNVELPRAESLPEMTTMGRASAPPLLELTPNRLVFASWPLDDSFFHIARIIRVDTVLPDWIHVEFEFTQGSTYLLTQHHSQLHDPGLLKRGDRVLVPVDKLKPRMTAKGLSWESDPDDPQAHVVPCVLDKLPLVIPPTGTAEPFQVIPLQHLPAFRAEIRNMIDPDDDRARAGIEEKFWLEVHLVELMVDQAWVDKKAAAH